VRIALTELRRRPGRFTAAAVILFLLSGLVLFLTGLVNGLNGNNDGVLRAQEADLVVFSTAAQDQLRQSTLSPDVVAAVEGVEGVAATGPLSIQQLGARLPDRDERDLIDVVVASFELPIRGAEAPPAPGQGLADSSLRDLGVEEGMTLSVGPARTPVEVVGFVGRSGFQGQGSLWVSPATFDEVVAQNAPGEALVPGGSQALVVAVDDGDEPADVAAAIDAATGGATSTLTTSAAADAVPSVDGGVLQQIIGLTLAIAVAVTALFFALLTAERVGLYGVLKAIGARTRTLLAGVLVQALVLAAIGSAPALAAALAFGALVPPDAIPFELGATSILVAVCSLFAASALGAAFSLRRVTRIDPASAIGASS
jgi:putative ABC transport system permease protein